jgi:Tfp pilus assembly protein PilZ
MNSNAITLASKSIADAREGPRAQVLGVTVTYERAPGESVDGDVFDLSSGGLFVRTTRALKVGKLLGLEIHVLGERLAIPVEGRVVWTREIAERDDRPVGMAVQFLDLEDDVLKSIARLVTRRELSGPIPGAATPRARQPTLVGLAPAPPVVIASTIKGEVSSVSSSALASATDGLGATTVKSDAGDPPASAVRPKVASSPESVRADSTRTPKPPQVTLDAISVAQEPEGKERAGVRRGILATMLVGAVVAIGISHRMIGDSTAANAPVSAIPIASNAGVAPTANTERGKTSAIADRMPPSSTAEVSASTMASTSAAKVDPPAMKKNGKPAGAPPRRPPATRPPKRAVPRNSVPISARGTR